jgi:hypothetical protein
MRYNMSNDQKPTSTTLPKPGTPKHPASESFDDCNGTGGASKTERVYGTWGIRPIGPDGFGNI